MGKYMIIRKKEYEFMKNAINILRNNNGRFSNDIEFMDSRINALSILIQHTLEQLKNTETARKKNASKIGGLTTSLNKEKNKTKELLNTIDNQKEHYETKINELEDNVKDLEVKLEESMSDKYLVKKLPAGRRPKTQTMKLKSCTVQSNIARKMFGDSK